jgi:hypothetical protein
MNFEKIVDQVETEFIKRVEKSKEDPTLAKEKSYVRFIELDED